MKSLKWTIVLVCMILVIGFIMLPVIAFCNLSTETTLYEVLWDNHGVGYYLTEENELYVGGPNGLHTDSYGLYETGFRWNFLYGTRRLLGIRDAVLFCDDVKKVFHGENGFLYTDGNDVLFYFGSASNGKTIRIAQRVISASEDFNRIAYITEDDEVFYTTITDDNTVSPSKKIASQGRYVYIARNNIRILDKAGGVYQISLDKNGEPLGDRKMLFESGICTMRNDIDTTCVLTDNGELICYKWEMLGDDGILYGDVKKRCVVAKDVCLFDIGSFGDIAYITKEAKVEVYNIYSQKVEISQAINKADIIGFSDHESQMIIAYSDGGIKVLSH